MGGGVKAGSSWLGRRRNGVGACVGASGVCGNGPEIWTTTSICLRISEGMYRHP